MSNRRIDYVSSHLLKSLQVMDRVRSEPHVGEAILAISDSIGKSFRNGGKLLLAGNGGSAADAQHVAAEFVCRFTFDRPALPAIALTTDTSALTAIGNDYSFERSFERQLRALGKKGDVFLGISTSGRSKNILLALEAAREMDICTVGFSGAAGTYLQGLCDHLLLAPSSETALIQQVHIAAYHAICGLVERDMFPDLGG